MKLHLGVIDLPYNEVGEGNKPGTTTGDVALILETKYGVMGAFYQKHKDDVSEAITDGLAGALENIMMGAPAGDPFAEGTSAIEEQFKGFLSSGEIEGMGIAGVPTEAAKKRRSLRFKKKKAKNARPSFIDTGLYQTSMKSWVSGVEELNADSE